MINPLIGSIPKARGTSRAIAVMGPIPGKTPVNVPIVTPRNERANVCQFKICPNPVARFANKSANKTDQLLPKGSRWKVNGKNIVKQYKNDARKDNGIYDIANPMFAVQIYR